MNTYAVNAPIGAAGNHLRWLMLLDNKFSTELISVDKSIIDSISPFDALEKIPNHIICPFNTIENKINFIENYVYHTDRSWHNWLSIEWRFRKKLDSLIKFNHDYPVISNQDKTVALTVDPEIAYKHYVKFNCNLNTTSKKLFMAVIDNNNYYIAQRKNDPTVLVIDSSFLFSPTLDKNIYNLVIEFCNFDNYYDTAQHIHTQWFNLNKKSEIEIANTFQQLYGTIK